MKKCTYCGKEYPDKVEVCAVDQQPLKEIPTWPPGTTLRQQLIATKLSDDFDAAVRERDQKRMNSILIEIGMKEKSAAFVVKSTLAQSGKGNRPLVTRGSPVVPILAALTMLGMGVYGFPFLLDNYKSGWTYSFGIVFDNTTKIYRSSSPIAFWIYTGFFMFGFVLAIVLAIFTFVGVVIDHKRKVAAAAKEKTQHDS
jgi:hypothetical protein